jgi:hypothetical protein
MPPYIAGITDMKHHVQLVLLRRGLTNFLPRLALNHSPLVLYILSSITGASHFSLPLILTIAFKISNNSRKRGSLVLDFSKNFFNIILTVYFTLVDFNKLRYHASTLILKI